jgi:hypothetical protein
MNKRWKSKQQSGTTYGDSAGPKEEGRSGREEFKKDVAEAVSKGVAKGKRTPAGRKVAKGAKGYRKGAKGGLDSWSVAELRKLINGKKHNLLTKAGFPDGKLPRSKVGMIALCKKLKRKRW